jgi:16S rRNA (uracil1498-N3)-methyltransferase
MELFYALPENIGADEIILDSFEENHLLRTLRKKIGDKIDISDGLGNHFAAKIVTIKPKLTLQIINSSKETSRNCSITLGVGFIRQSRMEFIIEKGTELGVREFILFKSQFCNHFSKNSKRFEKILRQAMKQSLQFFLPKITILESFNSFIDYTRNYKSKIAGFTEKDIPIYEYLSSDSQIKDDMVFTVGPEGGFTEEEGLLLQKNDFSLVSLGKTRLRTETAAISGTAMIQFHCNS